MSLKLKPSEVSTGVFFFLYSEMIRSFQQKVTAIHDLEQKLHNSGRHAGIRWMELFYYKERSSRRDSDFLSLLQMIHISFWKYAFGKTAESLEVSTESREDYMIIDLSPITNRFISLPKELLQFNPAAWIGGVIEAIIHCSGFSEYKVSVHSVPMNDAPLRTVFLIKKQSS